MEIVLKSGRFGIFAMKEGTRLRSSAEYADRDSLSESRTTAATSRAS